MCTANSGTPSRWNTEFSIAIILHNGSVRTCDESVATLARLEVHRRLLATPTRPLSAGGANTDAEIPGKDQPPFGPCIILPVRLSNGPFCVEQAGACMFRVVQNCTGA